MLHVVRIESPRTDTIKFDAWRERKKNNNTTKSIITLNQQGGHLASIALRKHVHAIYRDF